MSKTKEKLTIRPSSISTFVGCNYKWFRHHILGEPMIPNVRMTVGTAVHKGAEVGYTEKIKDGKLPPVSVLKDAAIEEFHKKLKEEEPEMEDTQPSDWEHVILTDIDLYKPVMEETQPKKVEQHYEIQLGSPIVEKVAGTADIILDGAIADIKTTARKAVPSNYTLQLSVYALLASRNDNKDYTQAIIHNIVHEKAAHVLPLKLNVPQARYVVNTLIDKVEAYYEGKAPGEVLFSGNPASPLCSEKYCNFYKICPFVRGTV